MNLRAAVSRLLAAVTLTSAVLLGSGKLRAQSVWDGGGTNNNFKTAANWVGDLPPAPGSALVFDGSSRFSPFNDFTAGTAFSSINFASTAAGPFTLTGNTINLTGSITDSTQSFTHTISIPLALQITPTISVTSFGSLTIGSIISGSGFGINETGNGLLTLSGVNTFSGPVNVGNGATLAIGNDNNLGAAPGSATAGKLILNGGSTLAPSATLTINANRGITILNAGGANPPSASINVLSGQTTTYNGIVADSGTSGGLKKLSFGGLTLGGANTYTGPTTIGNGTLTLDFTQSTAPTSNIISASSPLNFGTASGANAGAGVDNYNRLIFTGKASSANSQSFSGTNISLGNAVIQVTTGGSGASATLNLGALTHSPGGVVNFAIPATNPGIITTTTANTNGILGGWAAVGTGAQQNNVYQPTAWATNDGTGKIVPYTAYTTLANSGLATGQVLASDPTSNVNLPIALTVTGTAATNGSNVVTVADASSLKVGMYLSGNGLANAGVQGYQITAINGNNVTLNSNANANITTNQTWAAGFATGLNSGTTDINTLKMEPGRTMIIGAGNTLRLGKFGGVMRTDTTVGTSTNYIGTPGVQDVGTLTAGGAPNTSGEIVFTVGAPAQTSGSLQVESVIADNGTGAVTVVKTGTGSMKLRGHNTYSGGLYIESGRLQFAGAEIGTKNPDAGGTGPIYVFPGAQFFPSGAGSTADPGDITNPLFLAGVGINGDSTGTIRMGGGITLSGLITLTGNARIGGGNPAFVRTTDGAIQPGTMISGRITGNFAMDFGAAGNAGGSGNSNWISNPLNDWTGDTTIVGRTGGSAGNSVLHMAATNVIPHGVGKGNMVVGFTGDTVSQEILDLNGFNQQINGLVTPSGLAAAGIPNTFVENDALYYPVGGSGNTVPAPAGVLTAPVAVTLTLGDNNQTSAFGGIVRDNNGGTATGNVGSVAYTYITTGNTLGITKIGTGVQTLSGANSYTGVTNINNGAMSITGSLSTSGTVNVNTSATSAGALFGGNGTATAGTVGNVVLQAANGQRKAIVNPGATGAGSTGIINMAGLTVGAGSDLQFDLPTTGSPGVNFDQITVSGAVNFNGLSTITPSTTNPGNYQVMTSSTMSGTLPTLASGDTRLTFAYDPSSWNPSTNPGANQITVAVTGSVANLTWTGATNAVWDLHLTPNWTSTAPTNPNLFFNGDNVAFDDTGANRDVVLSGPVQPGNLSFNNSAGDYSVTGTGSIGGIGTLTKSGTSALTLGTANTFTGGVTLSNGKLNINNNSALGTGTTFAINGGSLGNTSGQSITVSSNPTQTWTTDITFDGPNDLNLGTGAVSSTATGGARTFNITAGTLTIGGAITENTAGTGITKNGNGTLAINANSTFAGAVAINAGTLKVGGATFGALGTPTSITVSSGAALDLGGITAANVANGFGATPITISGTGVGGTGALTNSGTVSQQNAFQNVTLNADSSVGGTGRLDIRGAATTLNLGNFKLTKSGSNFFALNNTTVSSGNGTIQIDQGTVELNAATNIPATNTITVSPNAILQVFSLTGTVAAPITVNGPATINDGSAAAATSTLGSNITLAGPVTFGSSNASTLTATGTISETGGSQSVTKTGAGTLVLTSTANAYSGPTNLNGGLINFAALGTLGTGTALNFAGGGLQYASGLTTDLSVRTMTFNAGGGTIDTNSNNVTFANGIGNNGVGGFTKAGQGTLILNGTSSYTGTTTVANGTLVLGGASSFPASGALVLGDAANDGGVLDLNGRSLTVSSLNSVGVGGNVIGSGSSTLANITLTYAGGASPSTYAGALSDTVPSGGTSQSLALIVSTGTLVLTGGSNSYSGATTINSGATLQLGSGGNAGTAGSIGSAAIANSGTLAIGGGSPTITNAINGNGRVVINSAGGTTTFPGANNYSGGTVLQAGRLAITADNALNNGTGGITFSGGTLEVNGYTTNLPLNNGNVSIGTQTTATVASAITTSGNFNAEGPGIVTVSAANTYAGNTMVNGGTLLLGAANRLPSTSNLTLVGTAGATFNTGGFSQTLGKLTLSGGGQSTIDLGSGASVLHLGNSSLQSWGTLNGTTLSNTLSINNWSGLGSGGGIDQIFVGSNSFSGLTHAQLNSINFTGASGTGALLLSNGELVPNTTGTPLTPAVAGDLNFDGLFNGTDINLMLKALADVSGFEQANHLSDGDMLTLADLNNSGTITNADIQGLLDKVATNGGGSVAPVPEPASWLLLLIGLSLGCLIFVRHRLVDSRV